MVKHTPLQKNVMEEIGHNGSLSGSVGLIAVNLTETDTLEGSDSWTLEDYLPYIMTAFAVLEYLLIAAMVLGNAFILAAYIHGRIRGRGSARLSPSGRLVLNLSFADLLVGLGLCYFSLFKFWPTLAAQLAHHRVPCILRFSICFFSMFGSHCSLLMIALDRYLAIVHTLHYKDYVTTRVSWGLILAGWTLPLVGSGLVFFMNEWRPDIPYCDEHYVVPSFLFMFALPNNVIVLILVSCTHWRVHREVQAYNKRRANADFVASAAQSYRQGRGSKKSAKVLLQVTGTFIMCWTPLDAMLVAFIFAGPTPMVLVLFESAFALAMCSFLINPFIYAWKTEAIRKPLIGFLRRLGVGLQAAPGAAPDGHRRPAVFTIGSHQSSLSMNMSSSGSGSGCGSASSTGTAVTV